MSKTVLLAQGYAKLRQQEHNLLLTVLSILQLGRDLFSSTAKMAPFCSTNTAFNFSVPFSKTLPEGFSNLIKA